MGKKQFKAVGLTMALMRLQKFLSSAGIASRRKAEELIQKGEVEVNGVVVTRLGTKIDSQKDKITFNRKAVALPQEHTYIMINKPPCSFSELSY